MEPIAILGVAGNVIQLIDFAGKLVSKTHSYRRSGSLVEHQDLQIVSNDLAHLSSKLIDDLRDDASSLSENDRALRTISESVIRISKDIEATLTAAALPGSRGRWKSFRHALKAAWGAEKLSDMKARLDLYSQQLQNRMHVKMHESVAELRNDVLESLEKVTDIAVQGKDSSREDLVRLREEAETNINQLKEELRALKVDLEKCIRDAVASAAQASKVEQRGLQEATNARFNLWAAKETILKQLQEYLASLYPQSDHLSDDELPQGWKLQPYPRYCGGGLPPSKVLVAISATPGLSKQSPATTTANDFQLWYPIAAGNTSMLKACLVNGADVNAMYTPDMDNERASPLLQMPPLISALVRKSPKQIEVLKMLLAYGADPNTRDNGGTSAFKYAMKSEDQEIVRTMIEALAKNMETLKEQFSKAPGRYARRVANHQNDYSRWDVASAVINYQHEELARMLPGQMECPSMYRVGPLHLAVLFDNNVAMKLLLDESISAFQRHSFPSSPVAIALRRHSIDSIGIMLEYSRTRTRDTYWYSHVFLNTPESYPKSEIIELILDNIPLIEALEHAVKEKDKIWTHRIAMRVAPYLLQSSHLQFPDVAIASSERGRFWALMERAYDEETSRQWIFEVDVQRDFQYVDAFPVSFAQKIVKWVEDQKVSHGIGSSVANLSYVLKAHVAREKMKNRH